MLAPVDRDFAPGRAPAQARWHKSCITCIACITWAQLRRGFAGPFHSLTTLVSLCEGREPRARARPDFRRSRAGRANQRASHRQWPQFKDRNLRENLTTVPPCSAQVSSSERRRGLNCGCSGDYISAPCQPSLLLLHESFLFFPRCSLRPPPPPPPPPPSLSPFILAWSTVVSSSS